jgi:hypothetical protein
MNKKIVASGLLAGLVAGGGAGLILSQTGLAGAANSVTSAIVAESTTTDASTVDSTDATDSTTDRPSRAERLSEVLQPLVDDGTINATQRTAVVEAIDAAMPDRGPGHGPGHGPRHGGGLGKGLEIAAGVLGLTTDELRAELEAGSTLADVATAEGVAVQSVIDAIVADITTHVNERVANGDFTQAEADAKLAEIETVVSDMVNNGRPDRDGHRGPGDNAADADSPSATPGV